MTKIFFKVCSSFWACEGRLRGNDTCKDGEAKNRKFSFSCSSMKLTRIAAWKMFRTRQVVRGENFSMLVFIILARFSRKNFPNQKAMTFTNSLLFPSKPVPSSTISIKIRTKSRHTVRKVPPSRVSREILLLPRISVCILLLFRLAICLLFLGFFWCVYVFFRSLSPRSCEFHGQEVKKNAMLLSKNKMYINSS